jgi:N-acetylglucosamine kinase-like BadF-type ATPase
MATTSKDLTLGVDGGNTKTIALLALPGGRLVGSGRAGCGDIYGVTRPAVALRNILAACDEALAAAGASRDDVVRAAFCLAGADWPEDHAYLRTRLRRAFSGVRRVLIANDALGALAAGRADGIGVAVACGTGSAIGGRGPGGVWHTSFWAEPAGGSEIVRQALKAAVRAELGIGPSTALTALLPTLFRRRDIEGVLHKVTRRGGVSLRELATAAPAVLRTGLRGDPVAAGIAQDVGKALGTYARLVAGRVGLPVPDYPLVFAGGLATAPEANALIEAIRLTCGTDRITVTTREPAWGALALAAGTDYVTPAGE